MKILILRGQISLLRPYSQVFKGFALGYAMRENEMLRYIMIQLRMCHAMPTLYMLIISHRERGLPLGYNLSLKTFFIEERIPKI